MSTIPEASKPVFVEAIAPIPPTAMREFFLNPNIVFVVDYTQSTLPTATTFLTYLTNIQIPNEVVFGKEPITRDDYHELMLAYLRQPNVMPSKNLAILCAQLLLVAKGVFWEHIPYQTGATEEMVNEFVHANAPLLMRWINFIDSTPIYGIYSIASLRDKHNPKDTYPNIDDANYVGHNVVNLFTVPNFTALYFSLPNAIYFEAFFVKQFEDYMFTSMRLEHWFSSPHNFIGLASQAMAAGRLDPMDLAGSLNLPPPNVPRPPHFGADEILGAPESDGSLPPVTQP